MIELIALLAATAAAPSDGPHPHARRTSAQGASRARAVGSPQDGSNRAGSGILGGCVHPLQNGGFELPGSWTGTSTNFGTPVCTFDCGTAGGTAGPRTGAWWTWFGGTQVLEEASVSQSFTIPPAGTTRLRFYLRIGASSGNGTDVVRARLNGQTVFVANESTPGFDGYTLVDLDVTAATGTGTQALRFESTTSGPQITNFNLDDVSVEWCPLPTLSVPDPAPIVEGHGGSTPAAFGVLLSEPVQHEVRVSWATAAPPSGNAATPASDYVAAAGVLTFPPGSVVAPLTVNVLGDVLDEFDEGFAVVLSAPAGATIADGTAAATIADDDALPVVSVGDEAVGESGTAALQVILAPASGRAVRVSFATANGTAVATNDYTATTGTLTFMPGTTEITVPVPILADTIDEIDETFTATATPLDFATAGDNQGEVTIDDDDGPSVRIGDRTLGEPSGPPASAVFDVTLSFPSMQPVTLSYTTVDGTATAGSDYAPSSGVVTFLSGSTNATVTVNVLPDELDEPNEAFQVVLSDVADATLADPAGTGLILDDDGGALQIEGELAHGFARADDLASTPAAARHLYLLPRPAASSWEVMVDAASGDVGTGQGPSLARLAPDLSTVLQDSMAVGTGQARRLSVANESMVPAMDYVEVRSAGCSTDCGADDVYRLTARETTLAAPRFNNSGGQATILVLQELEGADVQGTVWFWSAGGSLLGSQAFALPPREVLVLNSATVPGVAGQGGSVTVTHDARYGGLAGKAVALDPGPGFSFDTPLEPRRR